MIKVKKTYLWPKRRRGRLLGLLFWFPSSFVIFPSHSVIVTVNSSDKYLKVLLVKWKTIWKKKPYIRPKTRQQRWCVLGLFVSSCWQWWHGVVICVELGFVAITVGGCGCGWGRRGGRCEESQFSCRKFDATQTHVIDRTQTWNIYSRLYIVQLFKEVFGPSTVELTQETKTTSTGTGIQTYKVTI
jgi:hypothetical protein